MNLNNAYVYILSNKNRTVLYIGITNDLERRVAEHKSGISSGFTKKYNVSELLYYEVFDKIIDAIKREKQLKEWKREWKIDLVKTMNLEMLDLAVDWSFEIAEK